MTCIINKTQMTFFEKKAIRLRALGAGAGGDTRASLGLGATGDLDVGEGPVGAGTATAEEVDVGAAGGDGTSDAVELEVSDWDTGGGLAGRGAVLVVLLNDNTVLGNVGKGDGGVGDVLDGTGGTVDSLDANTVVTVGDDVVVDVDVLDSVVRTTTDGADGDTVTTGAVGVGEGNVGARVDGEAVILVLDGDVVNVDAGGRANVEGIGVVATSVGVT